MDKKSFPGSPLRSSSALLFCRMCQAVYRQPKLMPCLHSFCKSCLEDVVSHGSDSAVIVCPLCSHKTTLPPGGVVGVPDNSFLSRMCEEYISEVQCHIAARSLYPATSRSSEFTELRSKLTEELSHGKHSPPPSHQCQGSSQLNQDESHHATTTGHDSVSGQPTAKALEAIHNMGRLQAKIMSLQGEALRVTYAIDHVNQCMIEWHEHKEDLKRAAQRRSAQFQFFIKRMEHQLISQIHGKHVDDEFYAETDLSKTELRKVLKRILHEVNVLKTIQELGNDDEITTLSSELLGKSVGMTDVLLKKLHYDMDVPTQSIEEIVADWFGEVRLNPVAVNVFAPEVLDFTEMPIGNLTEQNGQGASPYYEEDRDKSTLDAEELDSSGAHESSNRSFSDSSAVRYNDEDLDKEDVREHLVQFQNVRETLRTRRREILVLGQQAREGASPLRDEPHRRPRSAMRKGRVQSLDRIAAPVIKKGSRTGLPGKSNVDETSTENKEKLQNEGASVAHPTLAFNLHYMTGGASHFMHRSIPEDIHVPSPVMEEVSLPHMSQRKLVKQTSDPHSMLSSLEEVSGSEATLPSYSQSAMEHLSNNASGGDLFRGRRHSSDHYAFISPGRGTHLDLTHDRNPTRLVRRAISGVADRKTKIDFLRENWQKRREILIQNEGFVSTDNIVKHATKSSTHPWSPTKGSLASPHSSQMEDHIYTPSDDHNHQMAEEQSCDNNDLTKQVEICNEAAETGSSLSLRRQTSDSLTSRNFNDSNIDSVSHTPVSSHYTVSPASSTVTAYQHLRTTSQPSMASTLVSTQTSPSTVTAQQFSVSLGQERTAAIMPHSQINSTTSLYSRSHTKPTEMTNVPSLIATISSSTGSADTATGSQDTLQKLASTTSYSSRHKTEDQSNTTIAGAVVQSLESHQPRRYPYTASRYNEGITRRHTIEVGQDAIQDALTAFGNSSNSNIPPGNSAHSTSQSRSTEHFKIIGPSEDSETTQLPPAESTDTDKIKYANKRYKTREDTPRRVPSPLLLMQEKTLSDQQTDGSDASNSATPTSSPQPPSSPTTSDGVQRVRLRELARKKKERWRHLTIH